MYSSVWAKYLPVIRIVLKRSLSSEQMVALNITDFERAGLKRKSGYKFLVKLKEGKLNNVIVDSPVASSFVSSLLGDDAVKQVLADNEFHFTLNPKFQLTIKHIKKQKPEQSQTLAATEV